MDRVFVYPGEMPLSADFLTFQRNNMVAIGAVLQAVFGTTQVASGFVCTQTTVPGMAVLVSPGALTQYTTVDSTAFAELAADTTENIVKHGINLDPTTIALTAPGTSGQSINYLIEGAFSETDINPIVLPYVNATTPTDPYSGPNNTGTAQNTDRIQRVTLQAKAGAAATTGTQTTPAADSGFVPLFIVTIAYGATAVVNSNISVHPNAPFVTALNALIAKIQSGGLLWGTDTGTAGAYVVNISPAPAALTVGMEVAFACANAPNAGACTLTIPGLGTYNLWGNTGALQGGELAAVGGVVVARWGGAEWLITGHNTGGPVPVGTPSHSSHAVPLGSFETAARYLASQSGSISIATSTTYGVASVAITFPAFSKTGAFRILARMVSGGVATTTGSNRQNFQSKLTDGTNSFLGANWLQTSFSIADSWNVSDTILTSATYAPGSTETFTMYVTTAGGTTTFTIAGSYMELYVVEA